MFAAATDFWLRTGFQATCKALFFFLLCSLRALQGSRDLVRTLLPLGVALYSRVGGAEGEVDLQMSVTVGESESRVAVCSYAGGRMRQALMGSQHAP